jgi:hypothetical protein
LDKNELAALLESLCDRPFADDPDGRSPAQQELASRTARVLSSADGREDAIADAEDGAPAAALASILSGTANAAQCHEFQEAAVASSAVRLNAQSALGFVDGIEQSPLRAPAHLVQQVAAAADTRVIDTSERERTSGIWSRISGIRLGGWHGRMAAGCAVLIMGAGLSWSLLLRPAAPPEGRVAAPTTHPPDDAPVIIPEPAPPAPEPAPISPPMSAPMTSAPLSAPVVPAAPPAPLIAPMPAPAQALADPCASRSSPRSEAGLESPPTTTADAAKRGSKPPRKTAAAPVADAGCPDAAGNVGATEAGSSPKADRAPALAARPGSQVGGIDRHSPAALSASRPAPAVGAPAPVKPARPNQPPR